MKELENAKQEMEAQFNSQKTVYEKEIKALGTTLEKQKSALEDINRKQQKFEQEKELLIREIETNKRIKSLQQENKTELNISPYKSNFLQEIEKILNETTAGAEIALTLKSSNQAMKAGGVSLYELQLLVREASERCRELGLNYVRKIIFNLTSNEQNCLKTDYLLLLFSGILSATNSKGQNSRISCTSSRPRPASRSVLETDEIPRLGTPIARPRR